MHQKVASEIICTKMLSVNITFTKMLFHVHQNIVSKNNIHQNVVSKYNMYQNVVSKITCTKKLLVKQQTPKSL